MACASAVGWGHVGGWLQLLPLRAPQWLHVGLPPQVLPCFRPAVGADHMPNRRRDSRAPAASTRAGAGHAGADGEGGRPVAQPPAKQAVAPRAANGSHATETPNPLRPPSHTTPGRPPAHRQPLRRSPFAGAVCGEAAWRCLSLLGAGALDRPAGERAGVGEEEKRGCGGWLAVLSVGGLSHSRVLLPALANDAWRGCCCHRLIVAPVPSANDGGIIGLTVRCCRHPH